MLLEAMTKESAQHGVEEAHGASGCLSEARRGEASCGVVVGSMKTAKMATTVKMAHRIESQTET